MALNTQFEIKEFNAAFLTGAFQVFGTPLSYPCYEALICNESDMPVYISIDGTSDNIRIGAGKTFRLTGLPRHNTWTRGEYLLSQGTQLYIRHNIGPGIGVIVFNALMTR